MFLVSSAYDCNVLKSMFSSLSNASLVRSITSYIVFSFNSTFPRCLTASEKAAIISFKFSLSISSLTTFAILTKLKPYKGPEAPPTLDINVIPVDLNNDFISVSSRPCSNASNPLTIFTPWSPSPMARSKSVNSLSFSLKVSTKLSSLVFMSCTFIEKSPHYLYFYLKITTCCWS